MGNPKMKACLLNAETIGKFNKMAVKMHIKLNRSITSLVFISEVQSTKKQP